MPKENTRNTMSFDHRAKLTAWLAQNKDTLVNNSDAGTADIAAKSLKFDVTMANIKSLREAIFPDVKRAHEGSPHSRMLGALNDRVTALEDRLLKIETDLGVRS